MRYKYIIPMKKNKSIYGIASIMGNENNAIIKYSSKNTGLTKDKKHALIVVNPKNLDYELLFFEANMEKQINKDLKDYTVCVIGIINGVNVNFELDGRYGKNTVNLDKLKQIITLKLSTMETSPKKTNGINTVLIEEKQQPQAQEPKDENTISKIVEDDTKFLTKENNTAQPVLSKSFENTINKECKELDTKEQQKILYDDIDYKNQIHDYLKNLDSHEETKQEIKQMHEDMCSCEEVDILGQIAMCDEQGCEFVNPFGDRWEGAWWKVRFKDKPWYYIVGRVLMDNEHVSAIAVPGSRTNKPTCLERFDLFAYGDDGVGYWILFQKD